MRFVLWGSIMMMGLQSSHNTQTVLGDLPKERDIDLANMQKGQANRVPEACHPCQMTQKLSSKI